MVGEGGEDLVELGVGQGVLVVLEEAEDGRGEGGGGEVVLFFFLAAAA